MEKKAEQMYVFAELDKDKNEKEYCAKVVIDGSINKDESKVFRGFGSLHDNKMNLIHQEVLFKFLQCNDAYRSRLRFDFTLNSFKSKEDNMHDHFTEYYTPLLGGKKEKSEAGYKWMVVLMKHYPEGSLEDALKKGTKLDDNELMELAKVLMEVLIYSHQKGYALCALTPDHIFLESSTNSTGNSIKRYRIGGLEYAQRSESRFKQVHYTSTLNPNFTFPGESMHSIKTDAYVMGLVLFYVATGNLLSKEEVKSGSWCKSISCDTIRKLLGSILIPSIKIDLARIQELYNAAFKDEIYKPISLIYKSDKARITLTKNLFNLKEYVDKRYIEEEEGKTELKSWKEFNDLPFVLPLLLYKINEKGELSLFSEKLPYDLQEYINMKLPSDYLSYEEIISIAWQLGNAIYTIHSQGYAHRDIKPKNIYPIIKTVKGKSRIVKVLLGDFGICKESTLGENKYKTMIGTQGYMAPEILAGKPYNKNIDVWSYGITLIFLIFKKLPYDFTETKEEKEHQQAKGIINFDYLEKTYYSDIAPKREEKKSDQILEFIKSCLIVDPKERPSMGKLLSEKLFSNEAKDYICTFPSHDPYIECPSEYPFPLYIHQGKKHAFIVEPLINEEIKKRYKIDDDVNPIEILEKYHKGLQIWNMISVIDADKYNIVYIEKWYLHCNKDLTFIIGLYYGTLRDYITGWKARKKNEVEQFAKQIIIGIEYLHSINIAHRTLRPDNIYIALDKDQENEKITTARLGGLQYARMTINGRMTIQKKDQYDAPEYNNDMNLKEQDEGEALKMADMWSYGMILYFLLFERDPSLEEKFPLDSGEKIFKDNVIFQIMNKCLIKDPSKRPTAKEVKSLF